MQILALDSALSRCSATVLSGDRIVTGLQQDLERGHGPVLARMARDALAGALVEASALDLIAVTVGPGSFTGIRGALALALGIGISTGVPVIAVTVGEALADSLPFLVGRSLWCAVVSRRRRVFLELADQVLSRAMADLPRPDGPVAIAGNAALDVAARLAACGIDVMLTDARLPVGRHIARVAERRFHGRIRQLPTEPLYVDPPEAKLPVGGLPPSPFGA